MQVETIRIESSSVVATRRIRCVVAGVILLTGGWATWARAAEAIGEYQVKAGFILNFMKFVEWKKPPNPEGPIVVGLLGKDPFGTLLDRLEKETVQGRPLAIRRIAGWIELGQKGDEAQRTASLKGCDTLFIASSEKKSLTAILNAVKEQGMLTVADTGGFLEAGGMINLLLDPDRKICFEINLDATRQSGLEVSSKLLRLAKRVVDQGKDAGAKETKEQEG
jgi:hypothetical protein